MFTAGMPVLGRNGQRVGYVAQVIEHGAGLPPVLVVLIQSLFGLRRRRVALTTYDVRDIQRGAVLLRITRWDAHNRAKHNRAKEEHDSSLGRRLQSPACSGLQEVASPDVG